MNATHWEDRYAQGATPWDQGRPDWHLVSLVLEGTLPPCRVLEIGCGTGTNAVWLGERGFDVVAVDVAEGALEKARARPGASAVDFRRHDILAAPLNEGFDLVYDRGCFHVFDAAVDRARFATNVVDSLAEGGRWLSIIGSTEGPARDTGPPRRSARDVAEAVEPNLEILGLSSHVFADDGTALCWRLLARRRAIPAQPSTRRG